MNARYFDQHGRQHLMVQGDGDENHQLQGCSVARTTVETVVKRSHQFSIISKELWKLLEITSASLQ